MPRIYAIPHVNGNGSGRFSTPILLLRRALLFAVVLTLCQACSRDGISTTHPDSRFMPGAASTYWTVINYWAVWCAPCREEIPELNHLARSHAETVRVFGVNYDGATGEALDKAIRDLGIAFPVLAQDPQPALGIARPQALPVTLLIKPDGTLHEILLGPQTAEGLWQKMATHTP